MLFLIPTTLTLFLNGIDTAYSRITAKRTGFELFDLLADGGNKIVPYIADYIPAIAGILLILFLIYRITPVKGKPLLLFQKYAFWKSVLLTPLIAALWLLCARGGLRLKPLRSIDAGEYTAAGLAPLVSSTPLQIMSTIGQKQLPEFDFMPLVDAEKLLGLNKAKVPNLPNGKNVVFIIVESLGRDYTGFLNHQKFTPFLDSLSKESINYRFCYANGTKSIEMVPAIFCGLPGLAEDHYINSIYSANRVQNIFAYLDNKGYSTAFFHGGANGTMGFQAFLEHTGLKHYYGLNEYPNKERDYDGHWGIADEPYLQYCANQLNHTKQPFFQSIFTLSSHHPYIVPEKYKNILAQGPLEIHQSIGYTDLALRNFFETAKKAPWFNNTIFVITGDHTSYGTEDYFYSQSGHYEIPLLIFGTGITPAVFDKSLSQCDIAPTILDKLGLQDRWFNMGRSASDSSYSGYSVHYDAGIYYLVQYPYVLGINANGKTVDFSSRYRNDKRAKQLTQSMDIHRKMKRLLEAYLQVYSFRIRKNRWF